MRKFKKAAAWILAVMMVMPSLAACSETTAKETSQPVSDPVESVTPGGSGDPAAEKETTSYISDDLPDANYDGYNFNILSCYQFSKESANLMMFDEYTGDPVNDVLYDSKCNIENRFNVSVTWDSPGSKTENSSAFRNSVKAQDKSFDISIGHDIETITLTREGLCLNLKDIPQFNMKKPWWPENTVSVLTIGDKMFAASTYLTYLGLHWTRVLTVNKDKLENLNMKVPYDMVREGTWTLDALHSMIEGTSNDTNGNSVIDEEDEVGLTSGTETWYCMQVASGVQVYESNQEGMPEINIDLEKIDKYVQAMDKIINSEDYVASGSFGIEPFSSGNATFAYTQVGDAYDYYRLSDVRYGFLPTPKLDEIQEDYINCCTDMFWAMPKTLVGAEAERSASIIEAFQCYNYNKMLPVYFEGALKARISDSPDDAEMIQIIADTRALSFAYTFNMPFKNIIADCVLGSSNVASYCKASERAAKKTLERLLQKFAEIE